jgi:hypothetical protein
MSTGNNHSFPFDCIFNTEEFLRKLDVVSLDKQASMTRHLQLGVLLAVYLFKMSKHSDILTFIKRWRISKPLKYELRRLTAEIENIMGNRDILDVMQLIQETSSCLKVYTKLLPNTDPLNFLYEFQKLQEKIQTSHSKLLYAASDNYKAKTPTSSLFENAMNDNISEYLVFIKGMYEHEGQEIERSIEYKVIFQLKSMIDLITEVLNEIEKILANNKDIHKVRLFKRVLRDSKIPSRLKILSKLFEGLPTSREVDEKQTVDPNVLTKLQEEEKIIILKQNMGIISGKKYGIANLVEDIFQDFLILNKDLIGEHEFELGLQFGNGKYRKFFESGADLNLNYEHIIKRSQLRQLNVPLFSSTYYNGIIVKTFFGKLRLLINEPYNAQTERIVQGMDNYKSVMESPEKMVLLNFDYNKHYIKKVSYMLPRYSQAQEDREDELARIGLEDERFVNMLSRGTIEEKPPFIYCSNEIEAIFCFFDKSRRPDHFLVFYTKDPVIIRCGDIFYETLLDDASEFESSEFRKYHSPKGLSMDAKIKILQELGFQ